MKAGGEKNAGREWKRRTASRIRKKVEGHWR